MDVGGNSVHEVAKELADFLRTSWKPLSVRLWDRFEPGQSLAWLVPSTKWPAYDLGKIFVQTEPEGSLFIGVYIEKGYAGDIATALGKRAPKALSNTWVWTPFFDQMLRGQLDDMATKTTRDYMVQVDVSGEGHREVHRWWLSSGQLVSVPTEIGGALQFPRLKDARSFRDLAQQLQADTKLNWYWIDMRIGLLLPPGRWPEGPEIKAGLDPWLEWVR